jgi:ATP-binding cassette subfamily F protein 3
MILLNVDGIRKHFGPEPVLDGVVAEVRPGDKIGLVGPNGCGKTTLLRILSGREEADEGSCRFHGSVHLGYLEQQPRFAAGQTLWAEARDALAALVSLEEEALAVAEEMAAGGDAAEHKRLAARYDHLQHELHRRDAYNLDHKIERVLQGLGFGPETFEQPVQLLSGGEQNRLMLAKLLLAEPNLMLLDEPSNHLDIEATEWLENFLAESSAALIVVSHDRYFLDSVTNRTLEMFHGTVDSYAGNFSAYRRQKADRLLLEQRTYEKQQIEIAKAKDFIRRNSYGQKHTQAEDRRKKLARIVPLAPPREIDIPPMQFPDPSRCGDIVIRAGKLSKAYERLLFAGLTFDTIRGERWALLGPNGCGKTTLLGCLLGNISPDSGTASLGHGVVIGYFDQHIKELDDRLPVVEAIRPEGKEFDEQQRRDLLARFGLTGDTAMQNVGQLSGGERCRAALARLAAAEVNLLVLDEPTNHLDLWACEALEQALRAFAGTVIFVSHDRHFVNRVADHLLVVEEDRVRVVEGNYQTYRDLCKQELLGPSSEKGDAPGRRKSPPKSPVKSPPKSSGKTSERDSRRRRFPYRKLEDIEKDIFTREAAIETFHDELARGDTHHDGNRVRQIKTEIAEHQEAVRRLYEHWDEAAELNW